MAEKDALAAELEEFEEELFKDDDGDSLVEDPEVDLKEPEKDSEEKPDETGQEAEPDTKEEPVEEEKPTEDKPEPEPEPNLTTLPDDSEAFGELAGKQVTATQLIEAGLLNKLVTWGHQGRHLIQKGQSDIEAAKVEVSEAQKLRELLEKRFEHEDKTAEESLPSISQEEYATKLSENYLPGLQQVAEAGGIEVDFLKEFPKSAVQIEHRFQAGSQLLDGLIKEVNELREFMGVQKKSNEDIELAERRTAASGHFDGLVADLSTKGDLYAKLGEPETRDDFVSWITDEKSGLRIAEKDVKEITQNELHSAWLLYAHEHPEAFAAPKKKANAEDAKLASGGGGPSTSTTRTAKPDDELASFEADLKESLAQVEY